MEINFDAFGTYRISDELNKQVDDAVKKNPERFANKSHFFRIAIMRLLKEESQNQVK
jgi:Arc/MetJ-type ribon-helix-helix transcriptional regulator